MTCWRTSSVIRVRGAITCWPLRTARDEWTMSEANEILLAIRAVVEGRELSADDASAAMDRIMSGSVTPAQIGALVTALRMRGETVEEIAGFASAMRRHALRVEVDLDDGPLVDTCGTGGDASGSF